MNRAEAARAGTSRAADAPLNYFNYYTEIEDAFIRRRGKHLLVSPLDWSLMESWKAKGVPLHVVLRGIEKSFDSYESRPRNRSVKTLFYCQEEVEAQFAEWLDAQRGASAGAEEAGAIVSSNDSAAGEGSSSGEGSLPFPRAVIEGHLKECCEALRAACEKRMSDGVEDALCEALARAVTRLEEIAEDFRRAARPDARRLEESLEDLEGVIDRALRSSLTAEALAEMRAGAEEQLRPYRARMDRATFEQTLENLLAKALRERARVPRLSLFYL